MNNQKNNNDRTADLHKTVLNGSKRFRIGSWLFALALLVLIGLFAVFATGCGHDKSPGASPRVAGLDSLPDEVREIVAAIRDNDSVAFSALISYPLERPYPLHDIEDSIEMRKYYPVMVDDSLKRIIAESAPEDWDEVGWRGWTVGDGSYLWIDGALYEVGYVSKEESIRRHDLVEREMQSLSPELRGGWIPEWCLEDPEEGMIYRIDADSLLTVKGDVSPGKYRLAIYDRKSDLSRSPMRTMRGGKRLEGTAGTVIYYFALSGDSTVTGEMADIVIEPFSPDTGEPRLHRRVRDRKVTSDRDLKRVYWLEEIANKSAENTETSQE